MKRKIVTFVASMGLLAMAASLPAETIEEAIARLDALSKQVAAVEIEQKTTTTSANALQVMETKTLYARVDGKRKFRSTITVESTMTFGDGESAQKIENKSEGTTVADGEFIWADQTNNGTRSVAKIPYDGTEEDSIKSVIPEGGTATVIGKEELNGGAATLIETTMPEMPEAKLRYWFSDEHGVLLKLESIDHPAGNTKMETISINTAPEITSDSFTFVAPEGVPVTEMPGAPAAE